MHDGIYFLKILPPAVQNPKYPKSEFWLPRKLHGKGLSPSYTYEQGAVTGWMEFTLTELYYSFLWIAPQRLLRPMM